jgi:hypothetical protein
MSDFLEDAATETMAELAIGSIFVAPAKMA